MAIAFPLAGAAMASATSAMSTSSRSLLPVAALLTGAAVWGVIWYPYRLLLGHGIGGVSASVATYGVALVIGPARRSASVIAGRNFRRSR